MPCHNDPGEVRENASGEEGKRNALDRLLAGKENPSSLPCMFFPREWFTVDIITDLQEMRA